MTDDVTLVGSQKDDVVGSCDGSDGPVASGSASHQELNIENVVAGRFRGRKGNCLRVQDRDEMLL